MEWAEKELAKRTTSCLRYAAWEEEDLWCLLHLQEYGAGPNLPHRRAQVSDAGSQPSHPEADRLPQNDNAFLAVDNAAELQAAADRLSAGIIGKQLGLCPAKPDVNSSPTT